MNPPHRIALLLLGGTSAPRSIFKNTFPVPKNTIPWSGSTTPHDVPTHGCGGVGSCHCVGWGETHSRSIVVRHAACQFERVWMQNGYQERTLINPKTLNYNGLDIAVRRPRRVYPDTAVENEDLPRPEAGPRAMEARPHGGRLEPPGSFDNSTRKRPARARALERYLLFFAACTRVRAPLTATAHPNYRQLGKVRRRLLGARGPERAKHPS